MQCWFVYNNGKPGVDANKTDLSKDPLGIIVTSIQPDFYTETKNLLIYSLWGVQRINPDVWIDGLKYLKRFAKEKECFRVIAYTDLPNILSIVKKLGGNTSITFISMEVGNDI